MLREAYMASEHENEQIFLRACTTNEAFRQALRKKDRDAITKELDHLGIKVADTKAVVDEIVKVNWGELYSLERRLTGRVHPDN
jgi:hypothetical protein